MKTVLPAVVAILFVGGHPQGVDAQTVWGLVPGDQFTIEHTVERDTQITIDGDKPLRFQTTERFQMQYRVRSIRSAVTVVDVRLSQRNPDTGAAGGPTGRSRLQLQPSQDRMNDLTFTLSVRSDGSVAAVSGLRQTLSKLTHGDTRAEAQLAGAISEQALQTWLEMPFWLTPPERDPESNADASIAWDRSAEFSMGLLGAFRGVLTFQPDEKTESPEDLFQPCAVTANLRFVPPLVREGPSSELPLYSDIQTQLTEFQGKGLIFRATEQDSEGRKPGATKRPAFESLNLSWTTTGTARANVGDGPRQIQFTHTQKLSAHLVPDSWRPFRSFPLLEERLR